MSNATKEEQQEQEIVSVPNNNSSHQDQDLHQIGLGDENSAVMADAINAAESAAAHHQMQSSADSYMYYQQQFQQHQKNIIATEVTREQIVAEFQRIVQSHKYDVQDVRFPLQIAKLFPLIQIYCYQQQEQIAKLMANEFWTNPTDPNIASGTIDPSSTIATADISGADIVKPAKKGRKSTSSSTRSSLTSAAIASANGSDDQSRVKRELARQANPHLTRARSLIARAKLVLGPTSPEQEIKTLAVQLLNQPRRTPKPQYRFDDYGNALVIEYINAWTNTKARRASGLEDHADSGLHGPTSTGHKKRKLTSITPDGGQEESDNDSSASMSSTEE